ncbi:putative pectin lyase F [Paramyrothecium foliicola]|nr:putative pectin lyase F [Paramyrothecium foliicola]
MKTSVLISAAFLLCSRSAWAQVSGAAVGFARGVTGGGSVTPAVPSSIQQLATWLSDGTPRVILIDREFDFKGSEGTTTGHACRSKTRCGAQNGGQDTIKDTCDANEDSITATWDNAGRKGLKVASNKSIVGVGSKGVIRGKGLAVASGAKNIIIQNIHFTDVNPKFVWGGDILGLDGCDLIWIDHNKFSLAGRQFIVSGFNPSGRVEITNNEFDGKTSWSSACNGKHNWAVMLVGSNEQYTMAGNFFHDLASRSPKLGQTVTTGTNQHFLHGYNNLFRDISGHAFDIDKNTDILLEANVFERVTTSITSASASNGGRIFNTPNSGSTGTCQNYLGRSCTVNSLSNSGSLPSLTNTGALSKAQSYKSSIGVPRAVNQVVSYVTANASVGKVTPSTGNPSASSASVRPPESSTSAAPPPSNGQAQRWEQCGGSGWTGPTACVSPWVCTVSNEWYSQCL